jgi:hypothetical protein
MTSQSSSSDSRSDHWATTVFRDTSTTPLIATGDMYVHVVSNFLQKELSHCSSRCYGGSTPEARIRLKEEFEEIFEISFGGQSELTVRLYHREGDHRARLLCKWPRSSGGGSIYSCLPLNVLEFHRAESSLQICEKRPGSSKLSLWASLKFSTIESTPWSLRERNLLPCIVNLVLGLAIFHCTLLSLRGHDNGKPVTNIQDYELAGETEVFGG